MLKHQPKTLAKTLHYITTRSPAEYGLFWDPEGTMPWKDFYQALQDDSSLRFVRQSTIRELVLLGLELPFVLDGNLLRLRPEFGPPVYPPASDVPKRLYFGLNPRSLNHTQKNGLKSSRRRFLALCVERELALRIAGRSAEAPVMLEILAPEALKSGLQFLAGGAGLFLVESVPVEFIFFPNVRQDLEERLASPVRKPKARPSPPALPGSFIVQPHHLDALATGRSSRKGVRRDVQGWKKKGRKERHKRDV